MKFFPVRSSTGLSRRQVLQLGMGGVAAAAALAQTAISQETATSAPDAAGQWNVLRRQLVLNPQLAYFDTAGVGPATRAVLVAEYRSLEAMQIDPQEFYTSRYNTHAVQQLCGRVSNWLNCSVDELALTRGAEASMEWFANWFNFQPALRPGDELVLCDQLSQAATAFWTRWGIQHGLSIKTLMLPKPLTNEAQVLDAFIAGLEPRSRIVVFSQIQHVDGAILPVREICAIARERKVISIVDGTLSLGAVQVSIADMNCDVFAGSFCHWLNGPRHTGVLYVRSELHPQMPYLSDSIIETLNLDSSTWPVLIARLPQDFLHYAPQFQALPAALSLQENIGISVAAARIRELSSYARLQMQSAGMPLLTPVPGQMWSNVLSISVKHKVAELINYLRHTDQVVIGGLNAPSGSVLRISFDIYNSFDDIDRLLRGLKRVLST